MCRGGFSGEGAKGAAPLFCIKKNWINRLSGGNGAISSNALLLLFIRKDISLDNNAVIDDYAKRNQRGITFISPLQWYISSYSRRMYELQRMTL